MTQPPHPFVVRTLLNAHGSIAAATSARTWPRIPLVCKLNARATTYRLHPLYDSSGVARPANPVDSDLRNCPVKQWFENEYRLPSIQNVRRHFRRGLPSLVVEHAIQCVFAKSNR